MKHRATEAFWTLYSALPPDERLLADKQFALLKDNLRHPSIQFKKVRGFWAARVSLDIRALAVEESDGFAWFWIGHHPEYERILRIR